MVQFLLIPTYACISLKYKENPKKWREEYGVSEQQDLQKKERNVISTPFATFNSYSRSPSPFSNAIPSSSFYTIPLFQMSVHSMFALD